MKKLLAVAFTVSTLFSVNTHAAPPSAASIDELFKVTKMESMVDGMYAQIDQMTKSMSKQALGDIKLTPEQEKRAAAVSADVQKLMREEMGWQKLKLDFSRIYSESLSQDEIDGLIAFYKSAAGQAFTNKMPLIMQKSMAVTEAKMVELMPKMTAIFTAAAEEAKAAK